MKKNVTNIFSNEIFLFPLGLFASLFFILGDSVGIFSFIRAGISYIAQPIYYNANIVSKEVSSYTHAVVELGEFRQKYDELSLKLAEKEIENSYYAMLLEENEALKKQIDLVNSNDSYVMSKVLNDNSIDSLRIDKGNSSGINIGDTVSIGNVYVGTVLESDERSSLVRLANSKGSSLEVVIIDGDWQSVTKDKQIGILSKAVATGSSDGIKIENISNSANIQNGSLVVVNDSKIGESLVLGYLVDISSNPAEVSRTAFVSPVLDYDDLITIFVKTKP